MSAAKKVLIVHDTRDCGYSYSGPFVFLGNVTNDMSLLDTAPDSIAAVVFTGGADISPAIYKQPKCSKTTTNPKRDLLELDAFIKAAKNKIPLIGVCRGAQLLCAVTGGSLIQHTTNHNGGGYHSCKLKSGKIIKINSFHHQMMIPGPDSEILGWTDPKMSTVYLGGNDINLKPPEKEPEIVYFYRYRAIGFQYHPESMSSSSDGFKVCKELIERYLDIE